MKIELGHPTKWTEVHHRYQIGRSEAAAPDLGRRCPKTRKTGVNDTAKPQHIVSDALADTIRCCFESLILLIGRPASIQFRVCRKLLSYNTLWQLLNSSIASMKQARRRDRPSKPVRIGIHRIPHARNRQHKEFAKSSRATFSLLGRVAIARLTPHLMQISLLHDDRAAHRNASAPTVPTVRYSPRRRTNGSCGTPGILVAVASR